MVDVHDPSRKAVHDVPLDFSVVVVPKRAHQLPRPPPPPARSLFVCSETADFRLAARTAPQINGALAVEIGASYGRATQLLAKRAARVIGVDNASEPLAAATALCGADPVLCECEFHQIDSSHNLPALLGLLQRCKAAHAGTRCLYFDIGGDGLIRHSAPLLAVCLEHLEPDVCYVKSRALWKFFAAARRTDATDACDAAGTHAMWSELPPSAWDEAKPCASDNARYRRAAAAAAALTATGFRYALDYEPKPLPADTSISICRFHNFYACGCTRTRCEYDHEHCYMCGQPGHRALDLACPEACQEAARTKTTEVSPSDARVCKQCNRLLAKECYAAKQWKKSSACCMECAANHH
jgi:SAM-dependent methyltransferase